MRIFVDGYLLRQTDWAIKIVIADQWSIIVVTQYEVKSVFYIYFSINHFQYLHVCKKIKHNRAKKTQISTIYEIWRNFYETESLNNVDKLVDTMRSIGCKDFIFIFFLNNNHWFIFFVILSSPQKNTRIIIIVIITAEIVK